MTVLATGIILYRHPSSGPLLLLLRNRDNGHWGFPKGRRDTDDAHEVATAQRELREETGYGPLELDPGYRQEVDYVVHGTADAGRRKRVVYFLACAPDTPPTLSAEHADYTWADPEQADQLLRYGQLRDLACSAFEAIARRQDAARRP